MCMPNFSRHEAKPRPGKNLEFLHHWSNTLVNNFWFLCIYFSHLKMAKFTTLQNKWLSVHVVWLLPSPFKWTKTQLNLIFGVEIFSPKVRSISWVRFNSAQFVYFDISFNNAIRGIPLGIPTAMSQSVTRENKYHQLQVSKQMTPHLDPGYPPMTPPPTWVSSYTY